jgi:uncharacterized ubiquitin-like protein YukD
VALLSALTAIGATTTGEIHSSSVTLARLAGGHSYSFLFSVASPGAFPADARLEVTLAANGRVLLQKTLHAGDPDFYAPFRLAQATTPELRLAATGVTGRYSMEINPLPDSPSLKGGGNHSWRDASPIVLGQTVFASADEAEYFPLPGTPRKDSVNAMEDWYRFSFHSAKPQLVYFQLELTDRDDVPVDVAIYRIADGKPVEFTEGQDPVSGPHEVQALPGNKFTPRVLREPGDYYVRVLANHPEYKLRTRVYPMPPYDDPHQAVRTATDYILGAGDSWFANTPRRGGVVNRAESTYQETSLCVGCHPSHFSQRAALYAAVNGYPIHQRQQLQFLSERFYNNPRSFYGFEKEGAVWARVISAPANVLGRMSLITSLFETQISGEPRSAYHDGIVRYLDLYYAGRTELPPDETNGNTPLVSTFEVAWYSWKTTHDARLPDQIAAAPVKNMIDLCYQTQALADIDRTRYAAQIAKNAERILSLQRPDGQWSMKFEANQPEVEFQTGHALWALAAAGIPRDNPQVKKAIDYLIGRQQAFGGWMDPLQSFENFKTPFRETQFAILALSKYFPQDAHKGWDSPKIDSLPGETVALLDALDNVWDKPSAKVIAQIESATHSNEVLVRQAAAEALGRLALPSSLPVLASLLGDPSKLVQRTAAWGLREIYSRHPGVTTAPLLAALNARDDRTRWAATRVFAHHFSELAKDKEFIAALESRAADRVLTVRLNAVRGLWQAWFWNGDGAVRSGIEDVILAGLAQPQHPWIESNLQAAVYNLADENIRYLYNNWVPLMAREEDRERAIRGRLAIEARLAEKFSVVLEKGSDLQKKELLRSLTEFPQRRGDVYDLDADLAKPAPLVYSRIGNDIEQIVFFGSSAERFAHALAPLLTSPDAETRRLAQKAALLVREAPFPAVNQLAGERGPSIETISQLIEQASDAADVAGAFYPRAARKAARAAAVTPRTVKLDRAYFDANVAPILRAKGKDGYACADCHATHTLFNATWSTIGNVVDTAHPEDSLVLRKPTSTSETEGIVGSSKLAHGGGQRWPKDSPEYQTILKWIEGARQN